MQLSEEFFQKKVDLMKTLISSFPQERREKVEQMMQSDFGANYLIAPASSKVEFHSCYDGGLLVHSLNVVKHLKMLADKLCPGKYDDPTLCFVGLFHDLGKAGDGTEPYYIEETSDWHRTKLGKLYDINKKCQPGPTSERGLFVLQSLGISLSYDEWQAIRLNDGQYVEENKPYSMKETTLSLLLHWADRFSCDAEKQENEGQND